MKVLEIKDLTKSYDEFTLSNVSFNIEKGYIMGFVGENGAGKTTTIKSILNVIKRDSGTIKYSVKTSIITKLSSNNESDMYLEIRSIQRKN